MTYGGIRHYSEWGPCGREEWKDPSFPWESLQLWAVLGCFVGRAETPDEYRTRLLGIRARFGDESATSHNCPAPLLSIIKESGEQGCLAAGPAPVRYLISITQEIRHLPGECLRQGKKEMGKG